MRADLLSHDLWVAVVFGGIALMVGMLPRAALPRARLARLMAALIGGWSLVYLGVVADGVPVDHGSPSRPIAIGSILALFGAAAASVTALGVACLEVANEIRMSSRGRGDEVGHDLDLADARVQPTTWLLLGGVVLATLRAETIGGLAAGFMACSGVAAWVFWQARALGGTSAVRQAVRAGLVGGVALMIVGGLSQVGALDPVQIDAEAGVVSTLARQRLCAALVFVALWLGSPLLPSLPQWRGAEERVPELVLVRWLAWLPALRLVAEVGPSVAPVVWGEWAGPFAWVWTMTAFTLIIFRGPAHERVAPTSRRGEGWRIFAVACGAAAMLGAWTGTAAGLLGAVFVWVAMALTLCVASIWEVSTAAPSEETARSSAKSLITGAALAMCIGGVGSPLTVGLPGVVRGLTSGESTQLSQGVALALAAISLVLIATVATVRQVLARGHCVDRTSMRAKDLGLGVVAGLLLAAGLTADPLIQAERRLAEGVEAEVQAIQARRCRAVTVRDAVRVRSVSDVNAPACANPGSALRAVYGLRPRPPSRASDPVLEGGQP